MYNLDAIFSEYIRKRDAVNGYVKCITCGGIFHWKDVDCGHYISRKYNSTRYNEINCNAQCRACNRFKGGREEEYRKALILKYGIDTILNLEQKKYDFHKLDKYEIDELKKKFKEKLKSL